MFQVYVATPFLSIVTKYNILFMSNTIITTCLKKMMKEDLQWVVGVVCV